MNDKKFVCYEEFGAVGDGVHDDMPAIVACHEYANEHGLDVRAKDGAEYYIGGKALTATIKTNTYFGNAKFTIDDVVLENRELPIFNVSPSFERFTPEIKELTHNQKKIDFPHEGTVYVRVYTDSHKIYIREGLNKSSGANPSDCFIVDPEGNILTDINWDYPTVSSAYAFCTDETPIVIDGGVFTTIANQCESKYNYHGRGIRITRSHVTVQNIAHYVTGELDHGAPYGGFLTVSDNYDVTLRDCLLTPHKIYYTESQIPGQKVGMGTYDLSLGAAIGTKMINLKQSIGITTTGYWGLMGSNYCKDMYLEDCEISRFDAHCGVTNAVIKNTKLGSSGLRLIGFGDFLIENTEIYSGAFISLREDYGAFFNGNITIKNCKWIPNANRDLTMITAHNSGEHNFGYDCTMPKNIYIDGMTIDDSAADPEFKLYLFGEYNKNFDESKEYPYPYRTPDSITLKNVHSTSGRAIELTPRPELYKNTKLITE